MKCMIFHNLLLLLFFFVWIDKSNRSTREYDVIIGTREFMFENRVIVSTDVEKVADSHEQKGRTAALIAIDGILFIS